MKYINLMLTIILVLSLETFHIIDACREIGEVCSKTVFDKCCGNTVCKLRGPFYGECVECLNSGEKCWRNSECCSGYCRWFTCQD
uniref:UPF0506 domain-containing protein n=1 Tax=Schistosoma japonicum TaxID=6182 RepID=C1LFI4_SCHJA|nr:hypothetical protein [Schistosoma japonicum]